MDKKEESIKVRRSLGIPKEIYEKLIALQEKTPWRSINQVAIDALAERVEQLWKELPNA